MDGRNYLDLDNGGDTRICGHCKKPYYVGSSGEEAICSPCKKEVDRAFELVRDYLQDHPGAKVPELTEELNLEEHTILYLIDSQRLEMRKGLANRCAMCGKAVIGMRLCHDCRVNVGKSLGQAKQALIARGAVDPDEKKKMEPDISLTGRVHVDTTRRR